MGPVGGILGDSLKGLQHLFKGELAKGAESLLPTAFGSMSKSIREATEGITTSNYGTVFYGDEPLKADAMDAFLRFLSFNPARISPAVCNRLQPDAINCSPVIGSRTASCWGSMISPKRLRNE